MKTLISVLIILSSAPALAAAVDKVLAVIKILSQLSDVEVYRPVAQSLVKYTKAHNMDYRMVLALLMTESSMNQQAISTTGDLGIGQINYDIWQEEFTRLKKAPLDKVKLKHDTDYAIQRTVEILSILKNNKDKKWIAKYHSKTPSLKTAYYKKINKQLVKLAQADKAAKAKNQPLKVSTTLVANNP
jgi:hypothetical protein